MPLGSGDLSEAGARFWSRLFLVGWLLLILSLWQTATPLPLSDWRGSIALAAARLFWGLAIPLLLLLLVASGTTLWRRVCPLAYVSQVGRALRWPRRRPGSSTPAGTALIDPASWLGRHHLQLQWFLLVAGLCLRLLLVNTTPEALALLFGATLMAALLVGWLWGGKTWCQYFCPMGPVEAVLSGLRPTPRRSGQLPASICRTITADGRERSTCVHCQSPCLDIDPAKAYSHSLDSRHPLTLAWWSYPGLVLAFSVCLMHIRYGDIPAIPQPVWEVESKVPHWISVPLLLAAGSLLSLLLFRLLHQRAGLSLHRSRLLATSAAVLIFFHFVEFTSLRLWHGWPALVLQLLALLLSFRWLVWGWRRES